MRTTRTLELAFWIILIIAALGALTSCNTLEVQEDYCEIVFAYDVIPETIDRARVGCACTYKDILKGVEVGKWELYPLDFCRRLRGFHPETWKGTIDPFFQKEYKKRKK